jgi:hypothetical protein
MFLGQSCKTYGPCNIALTGNSTYLTPGPPRWLSTCLIKKDKDGASLGEIKKSISLSYPDRFELEVVHYKPNTFTGCQEGYEFILSKESGTSVENEGSLSLYSSTFSETPLSEEAVAFNNNTNHNPEVNPTQVSGPHCGISNWELNQEIYITGLECSGKKMNPSDKTFKFERFEKYLLIDEERFDLQYYNNSGEFKCI